LPFWKSEVFYQHSVGIVPYVDIFCCICVVEGDHHDSSAILKVPSGIVSLISISDLSLLLYESESEVLEIMSFEQEGPEAEASIGPEPQLTGSAWSWR